MKDKKRVKKINKSHHDYGPLDPLLYIFLIYSYQVTNPIFILSPWINLLQYGRYLFFFFFFLFFFKMFSTLDFQEGKKMKSNQQPLIPLHGIPIRRFSTHKQYHSHIHLWIVQEQLSLPKSLTRFTLSVQMLATTLIIPSTRSLGSHSKTLSKFTKNSLKYEKFSQVEFLKILTVRVIMWYKVYDLNLYIWVNFIAP